MRRENSPGAISDNTGTIAQGGSATINDRTALYISVIALVIAALCLGLFLMQTMLMPQIIDSKVAAGVAKAEATANAAREHARVALDKVEQTQVQLGAKGLVQPTTH